ncbi:MAG: hypothetical protein NXI31_05940 [bacterium]|nr:hypothetical protein [bacterium]
MKKKLLQLACSLVLFSCSSGPVPVVSLEGLPPLHYPGFGVFPTPRTFDQPGYVFRVARDGRKFPVATLDVPLIERGVEQFATSRQSGKWTSSGLLAYLGIGSAEVASRTGFSVTVSLQSGARLGIYDGDIDKAPATTMERCCSASPTVESFSHSSTGLQRAPNH